MRYRALILLGLLHAVSVSAALLPDDHGNDIASATALAGISNAVSGQIEYDTDTDVFSFPFLPQRSYIIQVRTGTVWDIQLHVTPPGAVAPNWSASTVYSSPVNAGWTNTGAASRWYLEVSGQFNYTTGSYHLGVWEWPANQDADGDGMADAWEVTVLGSITNKPGDDRDGDGSSNLEEYLAQTGGNDPDSAIEIRSMGRAAGGDVVRWDQAARSTYAIHSATNIAGPWLFLGRHIAGDTAGLTSWTNAAGPGMRFYRVTFSF